MTTTDVIIVTENITTGATTIEVMPLEADASSNVVTEIIEAILDPMPDAFGSSAVEASNDTSTFEITSYSTSGFEDYALNEEMSSAYATTDAEAYSTATSTEATAQADTATQAQIDAATEAQAAADEAVARGDYEAAAYHREAAENASWSAGDNSMLHGSDAIDLESADWQQDQANYYEQQQAQHAQAGDYEAAREDAANAAYAHQNADWQAGGSDHSGQAQLEEHQMDWAVWEEKNADYYAEQSDAYAAQGDYDNAAMYGAAAAEHQAAADHHGDLGEHGGEIAVYDPASEVTHDASYSSYGYSSSYDAAASSYDYSSSYDSLSTYAE
jgi:hypothetical protein